jgi:hypothetical protein
MPFTCPRCLMTSFNQNDEREGYCGNCHAFTGTSSVLLTPVCFRCGRTPDELPEYFPANTESNILDPIEYVKAEEGTYNIANGHFCCTDCYIAIGMPTAPGRGWKAP